MYAFFIDYFMHLTTKYACNIVYLWQLRNCVSDPWSVGQVGSDITKYCINVGTDETTSKTTDHVHSELIEWQEGSIYDRGDS